METASMTSDSDNCKSNPKDDNLANPSSALSYSSVAFWSEGMVCSIQDKMKIQNDILIFVITLDQRMYVSINLNLEFNETVLIIQRKKKQSLALLSEGRKTI